MTLVSETFSSTNELAAYATGSTAVFFVVGSRQDCKPLVDELTVIANETEKIVHVSEDAKIFSEMEAPNDLPALGLWSAKGTLVGYRENDESVVEFIEYGRRFT